MVRIIEELAGDWHRLDQRIESLSTNIKALTGSGGVDPADHSGVRSESFCIRCEIPHRLHAAAVDNHRQLSRGRTKPKPK
jgi:hypothetical protein